MPDAPPPTWDAAGNIEREWLIVTRFDAARDVITISYTKDGNALHAHKQGAIAHPSSAQADVLEDIRRVLIDLHTRSLL